MVQGHSGFDSRTPPQGKYMLIEDNFRNRILTDAGLPDIPLVVKSDFIPANAKTLTRNEPLGLIDFA